MLQGVRQRVLRGLVLAGYLLALGLSGFAHEHTHAPSLGPTAAAAPAKPRCTHRCCHHHHHAPAKAATEHTHGGHSCPHDVPGHCPEECDACQFLGQCPLPVTLATVETAEFSRPHAPPARRALCTALVSNVHPARGPPEM
jgi:hypothetical protein